MTQSDEKYMGLWTQANDTVEQLKVACDSSRMTWNKQHTKQNPHCA